MTGIVLGALSHKGGTGRSVTTANVCYHLARKGVDVCIVDLDLASPTLGAILGIEGIESGAAKGQDDQPRGVADFLRRPESVANIASALIDAYRGDAFKSVQVSPQWGEFSLLPGTQFTGDPMSATRLAEPFDAMIGALRERFSIIYLDMRSGNSEVFNAFLKVVNGAAIRSVDHWMLHMRWTPQHLAGLKDLLEVYGKETPGGPECVGADAPIHIIRTAMVEPESVSPDARHKFVIDHHQSLEDRFREVRIGRGKAKERLLGSIPLEPLLQWREGIVTESDAERGLADQATVTAYSELATAVVNQTNL